MDEVQQGRALASRVPLAHASCTLGDRGNNVAPVGLAAEPALARASDDEQQRRLRVLFLDEGRTATTDKAEGRAGLVFATMARIGKALGFKISHDPEEDLWPHIARSSKSTRRMSRSGLPGRPNLNPKAVLQEVTPNRRLAWRGHLGADRLFTGYREFAIHPLTENKVRVTHVEDLQGWLAPVFEALMGRSVQRHHDTFNESLKSRAKLMAVRTATGG